MKPLFSSLSGCDISAESIARAREENPGVAYAAYSGPSLPYADGTFDLAFAVCVAHHVPPEHWPDFFDEMRRVVRPGGAVAVIEHNPFNPLTRLAVLRCPFDEDAVLISRRKAGRLFQAAGLSEIEGEHFLMFPFANAFARKVEGWFSACRLARNISAAGASERQTTLTGDGAACRRCKLPLGICCFAFRLAIRDHLARGGIDQDGHDRRGIAINRIVPSQIDRGRLNQAGDRRKPGYQAGGYIPTQTAH